MTGRRRNRATSPTNAARIALAGVAIGLGALASGRTRQRGPRGAALPDAGGPPEPGIVPAGQPVMDAPGAAPEAPPAPPPVGPPPVPEIQNPQYGQGSRPGPLGFLRDAWHQAQDPYGFTGTAPGQMPGAAPPPPGAGPAPQLPPGYYPLDGPPPPGYFDAASAGGSPPAGAGPAPQVPPGYYPLSGPPPPGYFDPAAPAPVDPTPRRRATAYLPVHSPPPPPLILPPQ